MSDESPANPESVDAGSASTQLAQAADALLNRMNQMSAAAQTGQLRIDPDEARALHKALREQLDRAEEWMQHGDKLRSPLPLGSQWLSSAMAEKFSGRVDGNSSSLLKVLNQYREAVGQAMDAMQDSINHYTGTEEANHDAMRRIQG